VSGKRWLFFALGATVAGAGAVRPIDAQSVYPVRFDDDEAITEASPDDVAVPLAAGSGASALTVEGEVLTLDQSGKPRLWGRGRPGTEVHVSVATSQLCSSGSVAYGLSKHAVDWGSAADACPAGFWVCRMLERGSQPCDTDRLDGTDDVLNCAGTGIDWPSSTHPGWIADGGSGGTEGNVIQETGTGLTNPICYLLPVWCCTDGPTRSGSR
jgi:hypothetical protein